MRVLFSAAFLLGAVMVEPAAGQGSRARVTRPSVSPQDYAVARAEIVNLSNRLMIASDAQDADTYAECFARNGVLNWIGGVENGREEIREAIATWRKQIDAPALDAVSRPRTRHFVLNHDITIDPGGTTGKGLVYWFAMTNKTPQKDVQPLYFGHVVEYYVKEEGRWLFSKREVFNESLTNRAPYYPDLGEVDPRQGAGK